ncbi:hypothetical protein BC835DRAFT_1511876 [Cytidiella melzeri]|nr:hypothetical protein BC835DRAFT_1511876 [Cytidiella melzeri]
MSTSDLSASEAEPGDTPEQISRYLGHLHEHISQVQQHIAGHDQVRALPPSLYAPYSYWKSEEKGRFFHALAVHSRFRPDLIAEHIGTKTFADVCLYLNMLEEALHSSDDITTSTGLKFAPVPRKDLPAAYEVSDEWLLYENKLASSLVASEPTMMSDGLKRAKEAEISNQKNKSRAKRGEARTNDNERDRDGEKARDAQFKDWLRNRQSEWDVAEALRELDDVHLRVLDAILREEEESWSVPRDSTQGSKHTSEPTLPAQPQPEELQLRSAADTDAAEREPNAPSGQLTEFAVASLPEQDVPMSPASRRRLQKRLYMRKKRAEKMGQGADQSMERLKPGRKAKPRPADLERGQDGESSAGEEQATRHPHASGKTLPYKIREHLDSLGIDAVRLRQDGLGLFRMTALARLMRTYSGLHDVPEQVTSQIAATTIQALHARVVAFTSQLVRQSIVSREQEMAAKTHTKAWRLAETLQKITTYNVAHSLSLLSDKSFDRRDHFANLLNRLDLEQDDGETSTDDDVPISTRSSHAVDQESEYDADSEQDITSVFDSLPLNRTVFPPFVRLPHYPCAPDATALHSYIPWIASTSHGADNADDDDDDILLSETDKDDLDAELADEAKLDEHDHVEEEAAEKSLWLTFKPSPEDADLIVAHTGTKRKRANSVASDKNEKRRKRKYGPRVNKETGAPQGRIKSAPFISDSD